jgi:uncharacterized membrane protein YfcA
MIPLGPVASGRLSRYAPFLAWVCWFAIVWLVVVMAFDLAATVADHWQIAVAMVFGSYIAGSTPMGGGTVGFPVLVLLFDGPASLGRSFSFCIQSVGMSSASIFILCSGRRFLAPTLLCACAAATLTLPLTLWLLVPLISDAGVKLAFGCIWGGFGILTLVKLRETLAFDRTHPAVSTRFQIVTGLLVGLLGGVAAGLTGVGADMVLYSTAVLLYRTDIRTAIASSVVVMAYCSLLGALCSAGMGRLDTEVLHNWLAAAPIVLIGAPLGSFIMKLIPRGPTLVLVACLCLLQLLYILRSTASNAWVLAGAVGAVLGMNAAFHALHVAGRRLEARTTRAAARD